MDQYELLRWSSSAIYDMGGQGFATPYPFLSGTPDEVMVEQLVRADDHAPPGLANLQTILRKKQTIQNWIVTVSKVPAITVYVYATSGTRRFGEQYVPPEAVMARYFGLFKEAPERTLDDVARSMETWRDNNDSAAFSNLFSQLQRLSVDEGSMPLMLSALGESYSLRDQLATRATFRSWLEEKSAESLGPERASRIFSHLA